MYVFFSWAVIVTSFLTFSGIMALNGHMGLAVAGLIGAFCSALFIEVSFQKNPQNEKEDE